VTLPLRDFCCAKEPKEKTIKMVIRTKAVNPYLFNLSFSIDLIFDN
jgi:hypothetical protein